MASSIRGRFLLDGAHDHEAPRAGARLPAHRGDGCREWPFCVHRSAPVEQIAVTADRGYFKFEDIEACEQAGMTPYVPKPQRGSSVREGFFAKDEFRYDPVGDVYVCPAGEQLRRKYESKSRDLTKIDYSNRSACLACALRPRCTNTFRRVSRLENEAVLDRMAARLKAVKIRPSIVGRACRLRQVRRETTDSRGAPLMGAHSSQGYERPGHSESRGLGPGWGGTPLATGAKPVGSWHRATL